MQIHALPPVRRRRRREGLFLFAAATPSGVCRAFLRPTALRAATAAGGAAAGPRAVTPPAAAPRFRHVTQPGATARIAVAFVNDFLLDRLQGRWRRHIDLATSFCAAAARHVCLGEWLFFCRGERLWHQIRHRYNVMRFGALGVEGLCVRVVNHVAL